MPITQAITVTFKEDLMNPGSNLASATLKCALYSNLATLNQNTTAYTTSNEISNAGTNYSTGGATLTNVAISVDGTTAIFDADNVTFANATISAQAALIYNNTLSNAAIAVLDFGGVKTSTNGTFELQFPNADATNGLIRIA